MSRATRKFRRRPIVQARYEVFGSRRNGPRDTRSDYSPLTKPSLRQRKEARRRREGS